MQHRSTRPATMRTSTLRIYSPTVRCCRHPTALVRVETLSLDAIVVVLTANVSPTEIVTDLAKVGHAVPIQSHPRLLLERISAVVARVAGPRPFGNDIADAVEALEPRDEILLVVRKRLHDGP